MSKAGSSTSTTGKSYQSSRYRRSLPPLTSADVLHLELVTRGPGTELGRSLEDVLRFGLLASVSLTFHGIRAEWEDLQPLTTCHSLHSLKIYGENLARAIGDAQLHLMAKGWPLLRSAAIEDSYFKSARYNPSEYLPSPTLPGLIAFATYCTHLERLVISVDARVGLKSMDDARFDKVGSSVRELRFPHSSLDAEDEDKVAYFIARMWPNHRHLKANAYDQDGWQRVWSLALKVMEDQKCQAWPEVATQQTQLEDHADDPSQVALAATPFRYLLHWWRLIAGYFS